MVELETTHELAEAIADMLGIYVTGPEHGDHPCECTCRMCFVTIMEDRIRLAVENETLLNKLGK